MEAAGINQPVQSTSTWQNIKTFFVDAGNWIGRNVTWLGSKIAEYALKVYEWAKPAFIKLGEFFAEQYGRARNFIAEHKTETVVALVSVAIGAIIYGLGHALCCNGNSKREKPV